MEKATVDTGRRISAARWGSMTNSMFEEFGMPCFYPSPELIEKLIEIDIDNARFPQLFDSKVSWYDLTCDILSYFAPWFARRLFSRKEYRDRLLLCFHGTISCGAYNFEKSIHASLPLNFNLPGNLMETDFAKMLSAEINAWRLRMVIEED